MFPDTTETQPLADSGQQENRPDLSFNGTDRVYPIRSLISVDQSSSSSESGGGQSGGGGGAPQKCPEISNHGIKQKPQELPAGQTTNADTNTDTDTDADTDTGFVVVTGQGKKSSILGCDNDNEPIYIPNAVQSFGSLLALREESDNRFVVRVASENSAMILGYSPAELFSLNSFCDILRYDQADIFLDQVDLVGDEAFDPGLHGPDVFPLTITIPTGHSRRLWCAIHSPPGNPDLILCEFELEVDHINPLADTNRTALAEEHADADTLGLRSTADQLADSTASISQPLRILRKARGRRGEVAVMQAFSILAQVQHQLGRTKSLDQLLNTTVGVVKELTGFHRIMIYQFDPDWNATVVAELVDPQAGKYHYKGLHFPASDIPGRSRDLYWNTKVRLLYDRHHHTTGLVCRTAADLETPLDMTHAYLRAMSPIHLRFLENMAVRASMSISICGADGLWGLISCHSYGQAGMRVSFPIRKICRLIGDSVSQNIQRLSYAACRLQARRLIDTSPTDSNSPGYIIASSDDLLELFDADYGALCICNETRILGGGSTPSQEILALSEYLKMRRIGSVLASHSIAKDCPDLQYAPGFNQIAGLLYVPLTADGTDFIVFFRRSKLADVQCAGNPYEREFIHRHLERRKSFQAWSKRVRDRSREWTESDVETAAILCLVYGKFIKVWRQKEAAMKYSRFSKLLLANSAHEVRTPLNAILNYLEIALEGQLDDETRDNLTMSYSASKTLIYVINDLLDLTNAEEGQSLIKDDWFDLPTTFKEATGMFEGEAKRKGIFYSVQSHPGLPKSVMGDQRRVRQAIANVISNAVQHTSAGGVTVTIWCSRMPSKTSDAFVEITVVDTGCGMSQSTLEVLFRELEEVSFDDDESYSERSHDLAGAPRPDQQQIRVLGLGLALVARIVRTMHGQLSVQSEEGKGSRFKISFGFSVSSEDQGTGTESPCGTPKSSSDDDTETKPRLPPHQNEFVLVNGERDARRGGLGRGRSLRSTKIEADRLIMAMQESPLSRSTSEGSDLRTVRPYGSGTVMNSVSGERRYLHPGLKRKADSDQRVPSRKAGPTSPFPVSERSGKVDIPNSTRPKNNAEQENNAEQVRRRDSARMAASSPLAEARTAGPAPATLPSISQSLPPNAPKSKTLVSDALGVLVAEDDPINSRIIEKRLGKLGHKVHLTGNGEECASAYCSGPAEFDVVLMDIQMPTLDGLQSTRIIREFEDGDSSSDSSSSSTDSGINGRVVIFAVSASLLERDMQKYIDHGFDGWILKPIKFDRLSLLLGGLRQESKRRQAVYQPGKWEQGGWFACKGMGV